MSYLLNTAVGDHYGMPVNQGWKARITLLRMEKYKGQVQMVGGGRHVQDGHYFYAKLSEKRSQITDVNDRLRTEIDDMDKNRPRTLQMMDKLQELTTEVKEMEAELQNYNLIVQKATAMASAADLQQTIGACQVCTSIFNPAA